MDRVSRWHPDRWLLFPLSGNGVRLRQTCACARLPLHVLQRLGSFFEWFVVEEELLTGSGIKV